MDSHSDDTLLYEVKSGDSLSAIAAQFGYVTPTQLARINRLSLIGCGLPPVFPGQKLIIPTLTKGSIDPLKVRRAPGTALRVRASSNIQTTSYSTDSEFTVHPNFYPAPRRTTSETARVDEENEGQFVKVPVQRLLPDGKLVNGVLLITPDALCFDAAQVALAQKRAFLAQHPSLSSTENSPQHSVPADGSTATPPTEPITPELTTTIPKELMDLGLCLPLSTLSSMTTLKTVVQHLPSSLSDQTSSPVHQPQFSASESNKEKGDTAEDTERQTQVSHRDEDNVVANEDVSTQRESKEDESPEHMTECIEHGKTNGFSNPCDNSSLVHHDLSPPLNSSHNEDTENTKVMILEADDALFLRLTPLREEGQSQLEHTFKIPTDRIAEVFAFLLRAGVGSNHNKRHTSVSSSVTSPLAIDEHDKSLGRRSIVEEALECMESATPLPIMYDGTSAILSDDMLGDIGANLPTHWIGSNLRLIYKTEQDGYSLHTLYRKARDVLGGVLLLIRDTSGTSFGAILSETMHCSQHFYGTGETCVFHWFPQFKRYDWTKKNYFFMRGAPASFQIGGQSGRNAIWFDEALKYGRSEPTDTFDNPVLSGRLQEFQFSSLSNPGAPTQSENSNPAENSVSSTRPVTPPSVDMDSVPFLIDSLEVWELVS